jgi:tetratricopeptide (TPR) repeat protein
VSVTASLATKLSTSIDAEALAELASKALEEGEEERALPVVERAAAQSASAVLWQWKALLERSLDEHEAALASFEKAARLAPADVSIAHGRARTAMEAGLDARPFYESALSLAPRNGQILVGMAAALASMGEGERAISDLRAMLRAAPAWLYGHEQCAQVMATQGKAAEATASLDEALARFPNAQPLWDTLLNVQLRRGAYDSLKSIVDRAKAAGVSSPEFAIYEGIHAAEFDEDVHPPALFGEAPEHVDRALGRWRVRHLLRVGAIDALVPLIDRELQRDQTAELWAYAATAWRLAGDPRSEWLEGDDRLAGVIDLSHALPPIDQLTTTLRALHVAKGEYLDQSVRGGTQTDGPLLSRIDPVIRHLRRAIVGAVEDHVARLPPIEPSHPMLRQRRDRRIRFSGSWSVRLRSEGHHSNHVHPLGWISSAL